MKPSRFLALAAGLSGLTGATPPRQLANGNVGFTYTSSPLIAPFSEKLCNDLTEKLCRNYNGYWMRYSVYDPVTGTCVCSSKPSNYMVFQQCPDTTCQTAGESVFYWPSTGECFCEAEDFLIRAWNTAQNKAYGPKTPVMPIEHFAPVQASYDELMSYLTAVEAALANPDPKLRISELRALNEKEKAVNKRQAGTSIAPAPISVNTAVPVFVPPPKTDITPALINQSLTMQEQNTATISSAIPHFQDGIITFLVQMNGPVADQLVLNTSTSLLCGAIGTIPAPDISVVPKYVQQGQGTPETIIANCLCIAVNMYNPNVINFYILNEQGKTYSLTGSNKVVDIDKLDTTQPLALSLVPIPAGTQKRDILSPANVVPLEPRQLLSIQCGLPCPFAFMDYIESPKHDCGCVFRSNDKQAINKRGISAPDIYSATMSMEACQAMTCHNNGGKPAVFNPFSLTCWCVDAAYIEDNPSAWKPST